jgi:hypothetical protein
MFPTDDGAPAGQPKKKTNALLGIASSSATSDPILSRVIKARQINTYLGGHVVSPWDVDGLEDEWINAMMGLIHRLPGIEKGKARVEGNLMNWRLRRMASNISGNLRC